MTKAKKLTLPGVRDAKVAADGKRREIPDALLPGFYLIVQPSGKKSWAARYRHRGKTRKLTLGSYPAMGLAEARDAAREALAEAEKGIDPAEEKRVAEAPPKRGTFEETACLFVSEHIERKLRPLTRAEYLRPIERFLLPRWGTIPLKEITRDDIRNVRDHIAKTSGPVAANRALAVISKFFNFCLDENLLEASPSVRIALARKEEPRERVLTDDELVAVWRATDRMGFPFGPLTKILVLTGQRRGEVAGIRRTEVDKDVWTIPRERVKAKRTHVVPLSSLVLSVIETVPIRNDSDLLFTSNGLRPVSGFTRAKRRLDELSGVKDWHLHDLRRTAVTGMRRDLKIDRDTVAAVVGHAAPGITARVYERYDMLDEKRGALEAWACKIADLVGVADDNVVNFRV